MIPSNFTIEEVLKLLNLTLEELKEYLENSYIPETQNYISDLKELIEELEQD